jgi:hypothetical protein
MGTANSIVAGYQGDRRADHQSYKIRVREGRLHEPARLARQTSYAVSRATGEQAASQASSIMSNPAFPGTPPSLIQVVKHLSRPWRAFDELDDETIPMAQRLSDYLRLPIRALCRLINEHTSIPINDMQWAAWFSDTPFELTPSKLPSAPFFAPDPELDGIPEEYAAGPVLDHLRMIHDELRKCDKDGRTPTILWRLRDEHPDLRDGDLGLTRTTATIDDDKSAEETTQSQITGGVREPDPTLGSDATATVPRILNSIHLVGEVWHLHYDAESGEYPQKGNMCIGWLAKLVAAPHKSLGIPELRGDPDGTLSGDASLGSDMEIDAEGIKAIKREIDDIDETAAATGGSEDSANKKADLLHQLKAAQQLTRIGSPLQKAHHNIATQFRKFIRKLASQMPKLSKHMETSLKLDFPNIGYYPPSGTSPWQI